MAGRRLPGPVGRRIMKIGLLGFGTVGRSVYELLQRNRASIERKTETQLEIKRILVRNPNRAVDSQTARMLTTRPEDILEDDEIEIVVEVMGGLQPALGYIEAALAAGKSVVTANKDVLASHGEELFRRLQGRADLFFEATVGGGIPIIRSLKESLAANRFQAVMGIVNGTTNYILTRMGEDGISFADALRDAQERGYAEADPSSDIEGLDAARKLAILASIAYEASVRPEDVYVEGIRHLDQVDLAYAREFGWTVKLLAIARQEADGLDLRVHPAMVPSRHPLAMVREAMNAIYVLGDALGEAMFYGPGAGGSATASAVVGDLIEAARQRVLGGRSLGYSGHEAKAIRPISRHRGSYYLRLFVLDRPGVLAQVARVLGENDVSLESVRQPRSVEEQLAELVLITHTAGEENIQASLRLFNDMAVIRDVKSVIRIEGGL